MASPSVVCASVDASPMAFVQYKIGSSLCLHSLSHCSVAQLLLLGLHGTLKQMFGCHTPP